MCVWVCKSISFFISWLASKKPGILETITHFYIDFWAKKSSAKCDLLKCYKSIVIVANYFNIILNQFIVRLMRTFAACFFHPPHSTQFGQFCHILHNLCVYYKVNVSSVLWFALCCTHFIRAIVIGSKTSYNYRVIAIIYMN